MSIFETAKVVARMSREGAYGEGSFNMPLMSDELLLECVLDHADLILWAIDEAGNFTLSRGAGLKELGLTDNQIVGQNAFELYADFPEILKSLRDGLDGRSHHDIVEVNGSFFESWYCPFRDESGRILGVVGISTVITDLASTRKALYDATLQFHWAFQGSPVMMAILKIPTNEFVEINHAFQQITGYSRDEVRGKTTEELQLWPSPVQGDENDYTQLTSFHDEEIIARTKSGESISLIASGAQIRFQSEDCILLFARDATAEANTRKALRKSEQRFLTLAKQAPVGIFHCDAQGKILYGNEFFWSCFEISNPASSELYWFELFEQPTPLTLELTWHTVCEHSSSFRKELQPVSPNRDVEWAQVQIDNYGDDDEVSYVGTLVDISTIKRAESASMLQRQELEKAVRSRTMELEKLNHRLLAEIEQRKQISHELTISKEHMQALLDNAVDSIMHINLDERIEFINRVSPGMTHEQVVGSHISEWVQPADKERTLESLHRILYHNELVSDELVINVPEGETHIYSTRGAPIKVNGKTIGASVVARDITRERELETQARQRLEELIHLSRLSLVGEMSASMSHELKQPLLAIGNYAMGCMHRLEQGTATREQMTECLQMIHQLSRKSCEILQRTREFVAKTPLTPKPTSLEQLIHESLQFIQAELQQKRIEIIKDYAAGLPMSCVDAIQIQQVIVNLLVNAMEAIESSIKSMDHTITIQVSPVSEKSISLVIRDTADGISDEMRDSLFDAFKTGKKTGLGMGLAISRGIMENHGGSLKVKQTGPDGTAFEMLLPICTQTYEIIA